MKIHLRGLPDGALGGRLRADPGLSRAFDKTGTAIRMPASDEHLLASLALAREGGSLEVRMELSFPQAELLRAPAVRLRLRGSRIRAREEAFEAQRTQRASIPPIASAGVLPGARWLSRMRVGNRRPKKTRTPTRPQIPPPCVAPG